MNNSIAVRSNGLARLERSLTVSSLRDLARSRKAENVFLLVDCSGSMGARLSGTGQTRIEALRGIAKQVLSARKAPVMQFGAMDPNTGAWIGFVDGDIPDANGGTPLAEAIEFARRNGAGRLVVISDGVPDDRDLALEAARQFGGRIDVVFVGDPGEAGSVFLDRLAQLTGGERFEGDLSETRKLTGAITGLLVGDVAAAAAAFGDDDEEEDEDDDEDDDEDEDEDVDDEE
jgi:CBS domain-containing protein